MLEVVSGVAGLKRNAIVAVVGNREISDVDQIAHNDLSRGVQLVIGRGLQMRQHSAGYNSQHGQHNQEFNQREPARFGCGGMRRADPIFADS
jgi:hypothetical protein